MNKFVITAAAAMLLGSAAISTLQAQEAAPAEQELLKKPGAGPATEAAPGQKQKSGETGSATEAAPGQQQKSGDSTAQELAPGQVKKQNEATTGEDTTPNQSATDAAPEQPKKSDQQNANEAAPGKVESQEKKNDQATDETKPSSETTASIDISSQQRTEIRDVIVERKTKPVDIGIDVIVGVVVPRTVVLTPLPPRVIEIVPAYSGYEYFVLADGRIVIVEPGTFRVVYILVV